MLTICRWIEQTPLAVFVRESLWAFPVIVGVHILALTFSVGAIVWFDLRLLGVSLRGTAPSKVYRQLMPLVTVGFVVMFITGALLFAGYATNAYHNVYFRAKLVALLLAGLNALVYHRRAHETAVVESARVALGAGSAKAAGWVSLVLWAVVILAGRMISYTLYSR